MNETSNDKVEKAQFEGIIENGNVVISDKEGI